MARLFIECGIYQIVNTKNGNIYVGSSNDLNRRLKNGKSIRPQSWSRTWSFISPDGTRFDNVTNLTEFAESHNLHYSGFSKLSNGNAKTYRKWKLGQK